MASLLTDLRDAVVTAINAGTYTVTVTAVAVDLPTNRLEDLAERRVEVMARQLVRERPVRGLWTRQGTIVVGIQKRVSQTDRVQESDDEMALSDAIAEQIEAYEFADAALTKITEEPTLHVERLDQHGVFCRVLVLHFMSNKVRL